MSLYTDLGRDWYAPLTDLRFRVVLPVRWEVGRIGSGLWVTVPAGYVFDVSIPRWARRIFDPTDTRYLKAACLHDWLLEDGWYRATAAGVFGAALRADGMGFLSRLVMVTAVVVWRFD